jgi:hypothetical protein
MYVDNYEKTISIFLLTVKIKCWHYTDKVENALFEIHFLTHVKYEILFI